MARFRAFGRSYLGGVGVAVGDFTGDGQGDVVVWTLSGKPRIRVFNGLTGELIANLPTRGRRR